MTKNTKKGFAKRILCFILITVMMFPCFIVRADEISNFTISQDCVDLIKSTEGFTKYKYWDYHQWSIGYGTGCEEDEYPDGITEEEAEELLRKYANAFGECVNDFANNYNIKLTQNQFDALVCLSYALGNLWVTYDEFDLKTILINGSENYSFLEIAKAFGEWRKAGGEVLQGLVRRRHLETELFLKNRTDYTSEVWRVTNDNGMELYPTTDESSGKTGYMVLNTIFAITEKYTTQDGDLWGKTYYEGKEQWCRLEDSLYMVGGPLGYDENTDPKPAQTTVSTAPAETLPTVSTTKKIPSEKWKVTSETGVRLRSGPGLSYTELDRMPYDEELIVTDTQNADGYLWGKTVYNGQEGWFALDYAIRVSKQEFEGTTLKSIYIVSKPDKVVYTEGEKLDLSGLVVNAVYSDGTEKKVTEYEVSGFESVKGKYNLKVSYLNKTATFNVTVEAAGLQAIEIESEPIKKNYKLGEGLAIKGLKVKGIYTNDTTAEIKDFFLENVDGFSKTSGKKKIQVVVEEGEKEFAAEFEVEVNEKTLVGIEVTTLPDITDYVVGQQFDTTGMIVHAVYDNGKKNIIDNYVVSGYKPQQLGKQTITISYSGFTDKFDVNVIEADIYNLYGDLDGNGIRDIFDLVLLNQYIEGECQFGKERICLADVNSDGYVNQRDVEALSRIVSQQ